MYSYTSVLHILICCTVVLHTNHFLKPLNLEWSSFLIISLLYLSFFWFWLYYDMRFYDVTCFGIFFCFPLFQLSQCAGIIYSIIICNTIIANWELVDTSCKYLNNTWLLSGFKVGAGNSSVSMVNLNDLLTSSTMRITSVSSIRGGSMRTGTFLRFGSIYHDFHDLVL